MTETVTPLSETVSQIVRSRTCGCRDFYIAKITQNDATGYVAGTPVKLARAIKAKVDEKWTSEKIYSDDGTEEVINSYEGTEVELEVNALAPQDRQILFGQLYENGFLIKTADDKAPEVAVGWRERKLNGKYDFKWLYAGKFAEGISEEASTKEGKLSPTTKSIKGSFYERSVSGGKAPYGIGGKGSLPSFSIQWYKSGGIMTNPTVFGINGSSLMVGGEAGDEAILPLAEFYNKLNNILDKKLDAVQKSNIVYVTNHTYIDGDEVASRTVSRVDAQMVTDKRKGR